MSRKIVVGNANWEYRVGDTYVVAKNPTTNKGARITISELTGVSWDEIQRAKRKGSNWGGVTPAHIAKWLGGLPA